MDKINSVSHRQRPRTDKISGVGFAFLALGALALIVPVFATTALVLLLSLAMLFWGSLGAVMSYTLSFPDWKISTFGFVLVTICGLVFLIFPGLGAEVLTMLVVASLLVEGIYTILLSLVLREANSVWLWMFGSGVMALIVGFLILLGWPSTASWLLGLGLGVNFITTGLALILLGRARRPDDQDGKLDNLNRR
jgi:uncharacterized membrane protein HdeD (DUF308 family)